MENLNLHKQKLFALILCALALIAMFLPWTVQKNPLGNYANLFGGAGGGNINLNGFRSLGFLSFLGIIGVIIASLMGDKTREYDKNTKMIALGGFGGIAVGALIYFLIVMTRNKAYGASAGFGVWIALIAGVAGLLLVSGLVKMPSGGAAPPAPPAPPKS